MIKANNIYLSFTKEFDALHNVSFEVADGEKVAFVGQQDSGKTMILRVLAKLETIKSGEIYLKNINIKKIDFKQDLSVGFVPCNCVFLNNKTVKENLEYILKIRNLDSATINLKVLTAMKYFGIESIQNFKIKELSPYQKVLIQLARVSMRKVDLYLIDDICNGFTSSEQNGIMDKIKELLNDNPSSTFVFAFTDENLAHELGLRCVPLKDGSIDEEK